MTWKKIVPIVFCMMISLFFCLPVHADTILEVETYDVKVEVDKNAVANVTETITFPKPSSQTWTRYLQQSYFYDVEHKGNAKEYVYQIETIRAEGANVKTTRGKDHVEVQLTPQENITTIVLQYQVRMRNYGDKENTIFLYQLLTNQDSMRMQHVTMQITFANRLDQAFSVYQSDAEGAQMAISYQIDDKSILLESDAWEPHTALKIEAELRPFFFQYSNPITFHLFAIVLSTLIVLGGYIKMMKKTKVNVSINGAWNVYRNPLAIGSWGYIMDGFVSTSDIVSILIDWANQGWIELYDDGQEVMFMMKTTLPANRSVYEKQLFQVLFENRYEISLSELKEKNIAQKVTKIKQMMQLQWMKQTPALYYNYLSSKRYLYALLIGIPMFLTFFACGYEWTYRLGQGLFYGISAYVIVTIHALLWVNFLRKRGKYNGWKRKLLLFFITACNAFTGIVFYIFLLKQHTPMVYVIMQLILTLLLGSVLLFTEKLTPYGSQKKAELIAFRELLKNSSIREYQYFYEQDPCLYQGILPYAYVFEIVPIVSQKVANMKMSAPKWYFHECASYLSAYYWASCLHKTLQRIEKTFEEETLDV